MRDRFLDPFSQPARAGQDNRIEPAEPVSKEPEVLQDFEQDRLTVILPEGDRPQGRSPWMGGVTPRSRR
ncbi:MAG: hypothetical protein A3H72_02710 [Candidatus Doudnabacteria bacterium RIFCSPLOWO2_02_FULL_48_8]|uniref:Uncharacterized protein n=1 Tax=Candidatus Doudnabacteria bacterium RIFCSPHIGHO2_01_FULL_46_24 TaxID=1817825 RepID=A0A1F5NV00_9BACT|nr:MAG: hypothetical protein A2720_03075 [Candidatus Doudnabacteria bacterium RIFCSPHIGHO2_01_FULL_46_24]OGE95088.1 MAG: hypothetical protein A3H72_02710 [Candidatus Doudnabacteria bacterium RIFCSPLOWO2_02_FULL_48_8]OGE95764.1 MAG: hypothetical protein A3E98_02845 [Candidatus Doudnabacteria bacterium RIFCSPHIGHO2_12_FULL_48_11]